MYNVTLEGQTVSAVSAEDAMAKAEFLVTQHPGKGIPKIEKVEKQNSSFAGAKIVDDDAKARIEKQHAELIAAGVKVNAKEQLYATGTRMADVGYATQKTRAEEFAKAMPIREVAAELTRTVQAERRRNIEISTGELSGKINVNDRNVITLDGYRLSEQALRGLCPRIESRSLAYLIGLRDRMISAPDQRKADAAMIADVLRHELRANGNVDLKMRVRDAVGDCFAIVSPSYADADAPEALAQIANALPADAKGTSSYDQKSTAWQLRANIFTPTPINEQAVGEAFEGYAALSGRDSGNGSVHGQGGVMLLRCLNASTYAAETANARRVHKGNVLIDVGMLFKQASAAIDVLCNVWGTARTVELPEAPSIEGIKLAREIALAGYFRGMLSDKRSEMQGVLVGRTEHHVEQLVEVYATERRNAKKLVKSDLAQAVTRYAQNFAAPVQRDAEGGIGQWLASNRPIVCDARVPQQ